MQVDWSDAEAASSAYIQKMGAEIRRVLASAQAAPSTSAAAGRELAQYVAAMKSIPAHMAAARAAAKPLIADLEKIGAGASTGLSNLRMQSGAVLGNTSGKLAGVDVNKINTPALRGGFASGMREVHASELAIIAAMSEQERLAMAAGSAMRDRLATLQQQVANERAMAAASQQLIPLVAEETNLRKTRLAMEKAATERLMRDNAALINADASSRADARVRQAATSRRENEILDGAQRRRFRGPRPESILVENESYAKAAEERRRVAIEMSTRAQMTQADIAKSATNILQAEKVTLEQRLRVASMALGEDQKQLVIEKDISALKAQVRDAEGRRKLAEDQALIQRRVASGQFGMASDIRTRKESLVPLRALDATRIASVNAELGRFRAELNQATPRITRFQRFYAGAQSRGGYQMDPASAPTARGLFASRAASTVGYAVPSMLLYGGLRGIQSIVKEANELQTQLGMMSAVFDNFQGEINGITFDEFSDRIIDISRKTAISADLVAETVRNLSGALSTIEERADGSVVVTPDVEGAAEVTEIALAFAEITNLPAKEIADTFSATLLIFREEGEEAEETAMRIADAVIAMERQFGGNANEILNFTSSLAALGEAGNFTVEQLAGFGAVVEQALGSDVAAAENIGRVFGNMQENQMEIINLVSRAGFEDLTTPLIEAFANNDLPAIIENLIDAYGRLADSPDAQQILANAIGSPREARTVQTVFARGQQVVAALNPDLEQIDGEFGRRWEEYRKKVDFSFDELARAIEELGITLYEAGLADALIVLANVAEGLIDVFSLVATVFTEINDVMGGLPAKLLMTAAAMKALAASGALGALGSIGGRAAAGGLLSGATGLVGGLFNPFAGPGQEYDFRGNPVQRTSAMRPNLRNGSRLTPALLATRSGTAALGLASTVAPAAAVAATYAAVTHWADTASGLDGQRESLRQLAIEQLEQGFSREEILSRIERDGGLAGLQSNFTMAVTSGFGLFGSSTNAYDTVEDGIQLYEAELINKQLAVVREWIEGPDSPLSSGQADVLGRIMDDYAADPTNNDLRDQVDQILAGAVEENADVARVAADFRRSTRQRLENDEAIERAGQLALDAQEATLSYQAGRVDFSTLIDALDAQSDQLLAQFEASVVAGSPNFEFLQGYLNSEAEKEQQLKGMLDERFGQMTAISDAFTGGDPEAQLRILQLRLSETTDDEQRLETSIQIRELQRQILDTEAGMIEDADERIAFLLEGIEGDAESSAVILAAYITQVDPVWAAFLNTHIGALGDINDLISGLVETSLEGAITIVAALRADLEAKLASVRADITLINRLGLDGERAALVSERSALEAAIADLPDLPDFDAGAETRVRGTDSQIDEIRRSNQSKDDAQAAANARLNILAAQADGDAIRLAQIARERAAVSARFATTESERLEAIAEAISADFMLRDALVARNNALRDFNSALNNDDPLLAAEVALNAAIEAQQLASGEEAKLRAAAERIRAERGVALAIQDVADAQLGVLIAMADASGDTIESARLAAEAIRNRIANTSGSLNDTEKAQLQAQMITADAALRDAQFNEERSTIQYQLEIGELTKQQAIGALQSLLTIPNLTEKQIREINLEIMRLRESLGSDFQFNLPTQLGLPTAYEVRRLGQQTGGGPGVGGYNHNQNINIQVYANTNANPDDIANTIANYIGDPNRVGITPRRY